MEELNEKRQGMVQRVKIAEKERDGLEAEKTGAPYGSELVGAGTRLVPCLFR